MICDVTNSTPQFIFRQTPCKNRNHVIDLPSKSCQISVQYLPNNSFHTEDKCNIYTVTLSSHHERDPHQCHIVHSGLASQGPAAGGRAPTVRGQNTSGHRENNHFLKIFPVAQKYFHKNIQSLKNCFCRMKKPVFKNISIKIFSAI